MFWKILLSQWERIVFSTIGFLFIGYSGVLFFDDQFAEASGIILFGFFAFFFANISRFKRFKGLGFEAELWEDKQKEAEQLVDQLRDVVSIYSREVIIGKVRIGRFLDGGRWKECWKLYDDLLAEHTSLGQNIDFSQLKKEMDDFFLFDMTHPQVNKLSQSIWDGRSAANSIIRKEFGETISDIKGYNARLQQLSDASFHFGDLFEISQKEDLASRALEKWRSAAECLRVNFGVEVKIEQEVLEKLECISKVYQSRPVKVTDTLVEWADQQD